MIKVFETALRDIIRRSFNDPLGTSKVIDMRQIAVNALAGRVTWHKLSDDTSWLDGRQIILLAHDMEVEARYCAGEWYSTLETLSGREYDGPVWSCFDDQFQIEIEECHEDPQFWHHGQATHWRELTERPVVNNT